MIKVIIRILKVRFNFARHLNFLMGAFVVAILFISSFIFFQYLYQPVFYRIETVFIVNPALNYELLRHLDKKIETNQIELSKKLQETYPDPFD